MKLLHSIFLFFCLSNLCSCNNKEKVRFFLTNNGKGKYWDLLYQTDTYGRQQRILVNNSIPERTIFFTDSTAIQYFIYDSTRIINLSVVAGDIIFDESYSLIKDTLEVSGHKYLIVFINDDSLRLQSLSHKLATKVYKKSKFQNRKVIEGYPRDNTK